MSNVTYLIGAGASTPEVPIVKDIPDKLLQFINQLRLPEKELSANTSFEYKHQKTNLNKKSKRELQLELIDDLNWLHGLCAEHPKLSIDHFAKQLSLKGNVPDLEKLKMCLSLFISVEQIIYGGNYRYNSFFTSILKDSISSLPADMKVICWNYDYQFELAYNRLSEFNDLRRNQDALGIVSKNFPMKQIASDQFMIFKVNGTASYLDESSVLERNDLNIFKRQQHTMELIEDVVKFYGVVKYSDELTPLLSFAWEKDTKGDLVNTIIERTKDTEVLVVTGYSFPVPNREIDEQILNSMSDLEVVYIQTLQQDMTKTVKRFESIHFDGSRITLNEEPDVDYFILP